MLRLRIAHPTDRVHPAATDRHSVLGWRQDCARASCGVTWQAGKLSDSVFNIYLLETEVRSWQRARWC